MKYFTGVKTIEELRQRYRKLLKKYHPDNENGSVEITQEINAEYDCLFADLSKENKADSKTFDYNYQAENDAFKEILNTIISYNMKIELIGNWIWCFDCFAYKDRLKELGFKFAPKKKAWTWHYGEYVGYHKGEVTLDEIRQKYGSKKVNSKSKQYAIS